MSFDPKDYKECKIAIAKAFIASGKYHEDRLKRKADYE